LEKAAVDQIGEAKKRKASGQGWLTRTKNSEELSDYKKRKKSLGIIDRANETIAADDNPYNAYRIAEIAFGANSRARSVIDDDGAYDQPGVPTIEREKRLGTMHLALGSSNHGEEGTEGFYKAVSHLDFVIPRNGLTVEMFTNQNQVRKNRGGKKLIDEGRFNLVQ
jgi:hypothetical protein